MLGNVMRVLHSPKRRMSVCVDRSQPAEPASLGRAPAYMSLATSSCRTPGRSYPCPQDPDSSKNPLIPATSKTASVTAGYASTARDSGSAIGSARPTLSDSAAASELAGPGMNRFCSRTSSTRASEAMNVYGPASMGGSGRLRPRRGVPWPYRHLRVRQRRDAQRLNELVHPPCRHPEQMTGGHPRGHCPLCSFAAFRQPFREIRAVPQLGDRKIQ